MFKKEYLSKLYYYIIDISIYLIKLKIDFVVSIILNIQTDFDKD